MRRFLFALLLAPGLVLAGDRMNAIKNCKVDWPGNSNMIQHCKNHEIASRGTVRKLAKKSAVNSAIVNQCIKDSPGVARGTDWSDALSCARYYIKMSKRR